MSRWSAAKKIYAMCRRLSAQRGGSVLRYFLDAVYCSYKHGASPENYFVLRFYRLSNGERGEYLTSGRSKTVDRELNRNASVEEKQIIGRKELFNKAFRGLVKRDYVFAPDCGFDAFSAFLDRHGEFIVKPVAGTQGQGIEKETSFAHTDRKALYDRCRRERLLLEERIRQHPLLDGINPSCINSVRVNAARAADGGIRLIGACLKCGGPGAVTDNFHTGGAAYPLDLETGRVSGPGRNNTDTAEYVRHPGSCAFMPGFQVPYWEKVLDCVKQGMEVTPGIGYVGWDIAITPEGPELIEGNYHWPGGNIIQFDGVGKYPLILSCLGDGYEKHTD